MFAGRNKFDKEFSTKIILNEEENFLTKWIFLGDESRRIFVSWILKIEVAEIEEEKSLILRRGETLLEKNISGTGNLIFTTYNLPPGIEIFLPAYKDNLNIDTSAFDNCAIFEMFPFGKESTEDLAKILMLNKKKSPAILFVMMDVVANEDDSPVGLAAMKNIFTKKRRDVLIAKDETDILEILHWHRPLAADVIKLIGSEIQDIDSNTDEIFDAYEKFLTAEKVSGSLSEKILRQIVNFSTVKGKNHIWLAYLEVAKKIFFAGDGIKNLLKLYRKTLYQDEQSKSIASLIWNADADCKNLEKKLLQKFTEVMQMPKKFQGFLNSEEIYSEHSYLMIIRKGSRFGEIDKEFLSAYENFVRYQAREILIDELENHIEKLKNL